MKRKLFKALMDSMEEARQHMRVPLPRQTGGPHKVKKTKKLREHKYKRPPDDD